MVDIATTQPAWHTLSRLAEMGILMPLALLVAWRMVRDPNSRILALRWMLALALASVLTTTSKVAFIGWGIGSAALNFTGVSGHTMVATAVYPVLLSVLLPAGVSGRLGIGLGTTLALLIGGSRVELGAHSWSEVIAGWLLGGVVTWEALRTASPAAAPLHGFWWLGGAAAWLLSCVTLAPITPTHSMVTRVALVLSGHSVPYTRHQLLKGALPQPK
jgi:membrane-associated phospholipid phosphatase